MAAQHGNDSAMNRLRLAQLRFEQLAPLPASGADEALSDKLEDWLRDEVVPVVEDLTDNPVFRRTVTAVPEQLCTRSPGAQRAQVNSLAAALVVCAQTFVDAAREFNVLDVLSDQDCVQDKGWLAEEQHRNIDARNVIEKIAERPWFDVVSPEDFWAPTAHLYLGQSDPLLTRQFRRSQPYSKLLGDHVVGMMFARLDFWKQRLEAGWNGLQPRLGALGNRAFAALQSAFGAFIDLEQKYRALRLAWLSGSEPRLRNACLTLLQAYVAYHPSPKLVWLHEDTQSLTAHGEVLRKFFRHRGTVFEIQEFGADRVQRVGTRSAQLVDTHLIQQVAAALGDISEIYHRGVHVDDLIEEARSQYRLLVVVHPRLVFWDGDRLDVNWDSAEKPWNLMLNLAVRAEGRLPLHPYALTGETTGRALTVRKSKLIQLLSQTGPGEKLSVLIEKPRGGDCRLSLASPDVKVLDLEADNWTVDVDEFKLATRGAS